MFNYLTLLLLFICLPIVAQSQTVEDDFEGNGTISTWFGDDCNINTGFNNPFKQGINTSNTVLNYHDVGGQYANVRFEISEKFDLVTNHVFSLKIYVPSNGLTGGQPNQVSFKLQNGVMQEPWTTQSEIIKPIVLDQWQTVTFDFQNDNYINIDPGLPPPTSRTDFNRVVIQINGEDNADQVLAYLDDVYYDGVFPVDPVYDNLVWSDEFDGNGAIDNTKWFHQTKLPNGFSWFNDEIQHYTNREANSFMENGLLKLVAKKETFTDQGITKGYTSARLNSKFAFTYGKVEVRAKLPTGVGTWPAIWMLGKNITENGAYWANQGFGTTGWPACGEIDIMEHWGKNQNYVSSAMHTPSSFGWTVNLGGQYIETVSDEFHVYALVWTPERMVFSVDNVVHYIYKPTVQDADTWPFDADQYLLLNIAIEPIIESGFTQSAMEIDYIRVYQESTSSTAGVDDSEAQVFYPNPVDDTLNVVLDNAGTRNITLKIYTIDGKLVKSYLHPVNNEVITLSGLGSLSGGMYVVSYELGDKTYSFKFKKR